MGTPAARARRGRARWGLALAVSSCALGLAGNVRAAPNAPSAPATPSARDAADPAETGLPDEQLTRMLDRLRDDSLDARRAAAGALCGLGPEGVPPIARELASLRETSDQGAASMLHALRDRGSREGGSELLDALLQQAPGPPAVRSLEMDCMVRALAHAGTPGAARLLVTAASDLAGGLRPEIGRLLRKVGEPAIPALVEARRDLQPEVRSWAASVLGTIVKHAPADALRVQDDHLLGEIMKAYGKVSDMEALPEILALSNSDRAQVRDAAREAVLSYGQDAVWRLREACAVMLGEQPPEGLPAADLARRLFEADDRYRLRDVYAEVDEGVALDREGKTAEAVAVFDQVLAREPLLDRRTEMVHAYAAWGQARETSDPAAARADLRRALRLDESGPQAVHLRAELHRLEGEALVSEGVDDTSSFDEALAIEPGNRAARDDLQKLRAAPEQGRGRSWRLVASAAVLAIAIAGIVMVGGRAKGRA
jgi:HEAT repeat protein